MSHSGKQSVNRGGVASVAPRSYSSVASQGIATATSPAPVASVPSKPLVVVSHAAPALSTPLQQISEFMKVLPKADQDLHRNAFRLRMQALTGKEVKLDMIDGSVLSGILHAAVLYRDCERKEIVIKAARGLKDGKPAGDFTPGSTVIIEYAKVITIQGKLAETTSHVPSVEFRTDASIKRSDLRHLDGRALESVSNAWLDPTTETSIVAGDTREWDQFETNKRLFNVSTTFDENLYTKKIDLNNISAEQRARADRLAREIETASTSNIHLQEERGHAIQQDFDEEARYSGVIRTDYTGRGSNVTGSTANLPSTGSTGSFRQKGSSTPEESAWKRGLKPAAVEPVATQNVPGKSSRGAANNGGKYVLPVAASQVSEVSNASIQQTEVTPEVVISNAATPSLENVVESVKVNPDSLSPQPPPAPLEVINPPEETPQPVIPTVSSPAETPRSKSSFHFNPDAKAFVPSFVMPTPPAPVTLAVFNGAATPLAAHPAVAPLMDTVPSPSVHNLSHYRHAATPPESMDDLPAVANTLPTQYNQQAAAGLRLASQPVPMMNATSQPYAMNVNYMNYPQYYAYPPGTYAYPTAPEYVAQMGLQPGYAAQYVPVMPAYQMVTPDHYNMAYQQPVIPGQQFPMNYGHNQPRGKPHGGNSKPYKNNKQRGGNYYGGAGGGHNSHQSGYDRSGSFSNEGSSSGYQKSDAGNLSNQVDGGEGEDEMNEKTMESAGNADSSATNDSIQH